MNFGLCGEFVIIIFNGFYFSEKEIFVLKNESFRYSIFSVYFL